jgi:hypothetical protein
MRKYIFLLFLWLLFGCELVVDVDVPFKHTQFVVNAVVTPDSVWSASISLNRNILQDSLFQKVEDAQVVIFRDGLPIDTLSHIKEGYYRSDTGKPLLNVAYKIQVSGAGNEPVNSQLEIIQPPAQITKVDVINGGIDEQGVRQETTINITFKDNPNEANYYQIQMEQEDEYYDTWTNTVGVFRYRVGIRSNDLTTSDEDDYGRDYILRKDVLFNGKEAEVSFKTPSNLNSKSVFIILRTLTADYFNYKTTAELQNETTGDPFAQPVNVFNNINNGFGIFAGYSQSVYEKTKPQPEITAISPLVGKEGDHFTIFGKNFSDNAVLFNVGEFHAYCQIVRSTENEVEAVVPFGATTGKLIVYTGGRVLFSDTDFVVIE